jgi:hypothetical protein
MTALEILEKIKAQIEKTYYSQGEGFDDYSDGFIRAKNEDLKILDCFITRAKWKENKKSNNVQTVCGNNPKWCESCVSKGKCASTGPQSEREFIEILAQNVPDDITPVDYRGKPYYSIHYKENGKDFVGFGTYKPEVLSSYLRDYFMKGDAK